MDGDAGCPRLILVVELRLLDAGRAKQRKTGKRQKQRRQRAAREMTSQSPPTQVLWEQHANVESPRAPPPLRGPWQEVGGSHWQERSQVTPWVCPDPRSLEGWGVNGRRGQEAGLQEGGSGHRPPYTSVFILLMNPGYFTTLHIFLKYRDCSPGTSTRLSRLWDQPYRGVRW